MVCFMVFNGLESGFCVVFSALDCGVYRFLVVLTVVVMVDFLNSF